MKVKLNEAINGLKDETEKKFGDLTQDMNDMNGALKLRIKDLKDQNDENIADLKEMVKNENDQLHSYLQVSFYNLQMKMVRVYFDIQCNCRMRKTKWTNH